MSVATKTIKIDLWRALLEPIKVVQREAAGRTLAFQITDGGQAYDLTGKVVTFYATKPDGTIVYNACAITDQTTGKISYTMTSQTVVAAGALACTLIITASGEETRTQPFVVTVIASPDYTSAVESSDEFTALTALVGEIAETASEIVDMNTRITNIVAQAGTDNTEIVDGRGIFPVLSERLNDIDSQLKYGFKAIVKEGLSLWLDGKDFANPPDETIWRDRSPLVNNGIFYGTPYTDSSDSDGLIGVAFDGVGDYCGINDALSLKTFADNQICLEATFTPNDITGNHTLIRKGSDGGNFWLRSVGDKLESSFHFTDGRIDSLFSVALVVGQKYHAIAQFTGTKIEHYINGVLVDSIDATKTLSIAQTVHTLPEIGIGSVPLDPAEYFEGTLYTVRIYTKALSPLEALQNYNAGVPLTVETQNTVEINSKFPPLGFSSAKGNSDYMGITGSDDTLALQALIDFCTANNFTLRLPTGYYKISDALEINGNIAIKGDGCYELFGDIEQHFHSIDIPMDAPFLTGTVLVQTANDEDGMLINGIAPVVDLHGFGIMFSSALTSTGHGINNTPVPLVGAGGYKGGLISSLWENIKVFGHDGDHYAFKFINLIYDTFTNLRWYGGGGISIDNYSGIGGHYGNSVFIHPFGQTFKGGTAHGINIASTTPYMNFITMLRPQAQVVDYGDANPATSAQYCCKVDENSLYIYMHDNDFETNVDSKFLVPKSSHGAIDYPGASREYHAGEPDGASQLSNGQMLQNGAVTVADGVLSGRVSFEAGYTLNAVNVLTQGCTSTLTISNINAYGFDYTASSAGVFFWIAIGLK